jgi:hypothetical protein
LTQAAQQNQESGGFNMGGSMGFLKWGYTPQNGLFVMEHHIKIDKILGTPNSGTP